MSPNVPAYNDFDRLLVVMSDIEMGSGGPTDDFPHSDFLAELIASYECAPYEDRALDLVFNGDTFDLLKTRYQGRYPHFITKDVALGKITSVAANHPSFFEALRAFLARRDDRRVHFIVGNHDPELHFPEVQRFIRALIGEDERVCFPGLELDVGDVHIEHGQQADSMFRVDPAKPFVDVGDGKLLHLSWASVALLEAAMPLQSLLYAHDRLKPRKLVLELVPELKEFLTSTFWKYWRRDFLKDYLRRADPMKKVSWKMLKELGRQFMSPTPEVSVGEHYRNLMLKRSDKRLYLIGHVHEPRVVTFGDRKVIRTGCMRNEFMLNDNGTEFWPIPKSYAEVYMREGRVSRSSFVEVNGPPPPEGHMPDSIFDVVPKLRAELDADADLPKERERRKEQEKLEAAQPEPPAAEPEPIAS